MKNTTKIMTVVSIFLSTQLPAHSFERSYIASNDFITYKDTGLSIINSNKLHCQGNIWSSDYPIYGVYGNVYPGKAIKIAISDLARIIKEVELIDGRKIGEIDVDGSKIEVILKDLVRLGTGFVFINKTTDEYGEPTKRLKSTEKTQMQLVYFGNIGGALAKTFGPLKGLDCGGIPKPEPVNDSSFREYDYFNLKTNHKDDEKILTIIKPNEMDLLNKALNDSSSINHLLLSNQATGGGVRNVNDGDYPWHTLQAIKILEYYTNLAESGKIDYASYSFLINKYMGIFVENFRYFDQIQSKSFYLYKIYTNSMDISAKLLPLYQRVFDYLVKNASTIEEKKNLIVNGTYLVGFYTFLSKNVYSASTLSNNFSQDAERVYEYLYANFLNSNEDYKFEDRFKSSLFLAIAYYSANIDKKSVARITQASTAPKRLNELIAKVQKQKGKWTESDKKEFRQIISEASHSGTAEGLKGINDILIKGIRLKNPVMKVDYYEQSGLTHNFALDPIVREINGIIVDTIVHPVDRIYVTYTFENTLPMTIPIKVVIKYPGTQTVVKTEYIDLPPNGTSSIKYSTVLSITSRPNDKKPPEYQFEILMDKI